ncbi:toxin [Superficieibacter sp. HKU1]|uniref:toxin n=1 Tax=Superficieibacter sp. HKU1 TaxID=3031919 RepID=UPI0023E1D172|nr:toxin [Superficieibacter sp. HKU1]WES68545.1 toxin [Superficieibacter sp. HKU1]
MDALFIELPPFERHRAEYFSDEEFRAFQQFLLKNPTCGDVIPDAGGLRKVRFLDSRRNKGKRGGIRVIYYWYLEKSHFLLFTLYDKDQLDDLTTQQRNVLRQLLEQAKQRGKS